jgi:hypothetical protein
MKTVKTLRLHVYNISYIAGIVIMERGKTMYFYEFMKNRITMKSYGNGESFNVICPLDDKQLIACDTKGVILIINIKSKEVLFQINMINNLRINDVFRTFTPYEIGIATHEGLYYGTIDLNRWSIRLAKNQYFADKYVKYWMTSQINDSKAISFTEGIAMDYPKRYRLLNTKGGSSRILPAVYP